MGKCFLLVVFLNILTVKHLLLIVHLLCLMLTELFHVYSMMRGDTVSKTSRLCLLHAANSVVGLNMCLLIPIIKSTKTLQIYSLSRLITGSYFCLAGLAAYCNNSFFPGLWMLRSDPILLIEKINTNKN